MLRHHVQKSAAAAKKYYQTADYYLEGREQSAGLGGRGAERLGVAGSAAKEHFERLCDNIHPLIAGERLTARLNDDRIVGIDLTFDGPKSFSVLAALTGDPRLRQALDEAAEETMRELEHVAGTRVRKGGKEENRTTGELVWYRASHDTTRPVDGVPDMQPHLHFFVLNATWDPVEQQWKAANLFDVLRDAPYYQAAFHARLANRLETLGYGVVRKGKSFEVEGVSQSVITKFSRRTQLIEEEAKKQGITDPTEKAELGAKTREHKADHFTVEQLQRLWVARLSKREMDQLAEVVEQAQAREGTAWHTPRVSPEQALAHAAVHVFERRSSAPARTVLAEALTFGVGAVSVEDAWKNLESADRFTADVDGRLFAASRSVLAEEKRLTRLAAQGRATLAPINPEWEIQNTRLNIGQRAAVHHLLSSADFVTMVVGDAGVGKTTLVKEAIEGAEAAGLKVLSFAPSAAASRKTMREEGFTGADTVAMFLADKELQARARGQILLVDEAALLGTKDTAAVLQRAKELEARVWVVGDDKQHRAVVRGAPFELFQQQAGIQPVRVQEVLRQQGTYKRAVELARDQPGEAIDRLRAMGWVKEVADEERYQLLASDYLEAVKKVKVRGEWKEPTALVVAPTHKEAAKVTAEIRTGLRARGKLGEEHDFLQLTNLHLSEAQRSDPLAIEPGTVLQFLQNAKGFRRGARVTVGEGQAVPTQLASRFQVYRPGTLRVAKGDRLRITQNGKTREGHRLDNGDIVTVAGFVKNGIVDHRGWVIPADYGHLAHGFVVTSVASQSRTVDRLLAAMGPESLPATNRAQLYVTLSRGRDWARIYTHSANDLARAVKKDEVQISATELAARRRAQRARRSMMRKTVALLQRRVVHERSHPTPAVDRALGQLAERHFDRGLAHER